MGAWGKAVIGEQSSPLRRPPASFGSFSTGKRNSPRRAKPCKRAAQCAAPTAYTEAVPPFRRGRTLAGPQMYAVRPGGRVLQAPAATCSAKSGAVVKS